jgi:arsenite methyltransferase
MTAEDGTDLATAALATGGQLDGAALKSCCAAVYAHPAVRWLLGDELHPGGPQTTRRALELAGVGPGDRLLDVASGSGASALLAARELGASVVGVEYGADAVRAATEAAGSVRLGARVSFVQGDAEALPVDDGAFDVALCECSLCTFPDQARAMAELRRALRPGGRLVLSDVIAEKERLPASLRGDLATIACVGSALPVDGYERLLAEAGFEAVRIESRDEDAARLAERVEERLRGARLLGFGSLAELPLSVEDALARIGEVREAIAGGALGYAIFSAVRE